MRVFALVASFAVVFLLGCTPPAPTPPPSPPAAVTPVLTLKQFMEWVIDPAADVVWDSVKSISTEAGTKEVSPQTDEQWAAVRNAAATLIESGNMLMIDARVRDRKDWLGGARGLIKTASAVLKAAETKDKDAVFAAGGEIYTVCRGCHQLYAPHLNASLPRHDMMVASAPRGWARSKRP